MQLCDSTLKFFATNAQAFVTDHEMALEELFGEKAENSRKYNECLSTMACRIATVFASLRVCPLSNSFKLCLCLFGS